MVCPVGGGLLKIVHLGKFYPPVDGGIERVTHCLAHGQAFKGHNVSVVCFQRGSLGTLLDGWDGSVRVIRCGVDFVAFSQPVAWRYVSAGLKACLAAGVVHLHAPNMLGAMLCLLLPARVKVLVHWHSDVIGKGWIGRFFSPLEYCLLRRADVVVATSPSYVESSKPLRRFAKKVRVIPNAALEPNSTVIPLSQRITSFVRGRRIVLSVGRLVAYKGFDILIRACRLLPEDTVVVIVGDGPLRGPLEAEIKSLGLDDRVLLAGHVESTELVSLYQCSTLFCLPSVSRSEAFGVVLVEAMSYGLPLVVADVSGSGLAWVNAHDVSGLCVNEADPEKIAAGCVRILGDSALHGRLSRGGRARFQSMFTEDKQIESFEQTYQNLI